MGLDRFRDERTDGSFGRPTVPRLSDEQRDELLSELTEPTETEPTQGTQDVSDLETPEFSQFVVADADDE